MPILLIAFALLSHPSDTVRVCQVTSEEQCRTETRQCLWQRGQCTSVLAAASLFPSKAIIDGYPHLVALRENHIAGPILSDGNNHIVARYLREKDGQPSSLHELNLPVLSRRLSLLLAADRGAACSSGPASKGDLDLLRHVQGSPGSALKVGWALASQSDADTAITYAFEKELVGYADGLPRLYWPGSGGMAHMAYSECRALWLIVHALAPHRLQHIFTHQGGGLLPDLIEEHKVLTRHPQAFRWLDIYPEDDLGPLELKTGKFFYSHETLFNELRALLPLLDVPPIEDGSPTWRKQASFPGERRVQIHVSVAFARQAPPQSGIREADDKINLVSMDEGLRKQVYALGIYVSDYLSLNALYNSQRTYSPLPGVVTDKTYVADLITDEYNGPWLQSELQKLWHQKRARSRRRRAQSAAPKPYWANPSGFKNHPVGLRSSIIYMPFDVNRSASVESAISFRIGFEFRKGWRNLDELEVLVQEISRVLSEIRLGQTNDGLRLRLNDRDRSLAEIKRYIMARITTLASAEQRRFAHALAHEAKQDVALLGVYLDREKGWKNVSRNIFDSPHPDRAFSSTFLSGDGLTTYTSNIARSIEFILCTPWPKVLSPEQAAALTHANFTQLSQSFMAMQQARRKEGLSLETLKRQIYLDGGDFPPEVNRTIQDFLGALVAAASELRDKF